MTLTTIGYGDVYPVTVLGRILAGMTAISGIGLMIGLFVLLVGNPAIEPALGIASIGFYAGMLLFAFIALPAVWKKP